MRSNIEHMFIIASVGDLLVDNDIFKITLCSCKFLLDRAFNITRKRTSCKIFAGNHSDTFHGKESIPNNITVVSAINVITWKSDW